MRQKIKIPRIIKINWIDSLLISVVFNNGESRVIDFNKLFNKIGVKKTSPWYILMDEKEFAQVELIDHTLSWKNAGSELPSVNGGTQWYPFDIGADTLYENSEPEHQESIKIGNMLQEARRAQSLTQEELAKRSGTTRNYISRIENNRSDLELGTLRKIIEVGLGKKLTISID